ASYPWFDPNSFASFDPARFVNRAVTDTWEPWSVNKTITAAAALESGAVTPTERFAVPGTRQVEGYTIHDAEPHGTETMTLGDGGTWAQTRLVDATIGPDGVRHEASPPVTRRVLRPSMTQTLTQMLAYVVQDGTGVSAQIPGYQVAGKTGTAKKLDANRHY